MPGRQEGILALRAKNLPKMQYLEKYSFLFKTKKNGSRYWHSGDLTKFSLKTAHWILLLTAYTFRFLPILEVFSGQKGENGKSIAT